MTDPNCMFPPTTQFALFDEEHGRFNKDSEFLDEIVKEQIEVGGVPVNVYRMLGVFTQTRDPLNIKRNLLDDGIDFGSFMNIQDPILGENRDRAYDFDEIPRIKGVYQVSQNDLEYAKFGLVGLTNNVVTMEFHLKSVEAILGRKFIPGDVVEMPHLRSVAVDGRVSNVWYEVASVTKSPTGYDAMYGFHVLAIVMRPMRDAQEFIDLLERKDDYGKTLAEQRSNREAMLNVTAAVQGIADAQAPTTMMDVSRIYVDPKNGTLFTDKVFFDDGKPPNGIPVDSGNRFPENPVDDDYFVRTDLYPNRLYQFQNGRWLTREIDAKREWQPYNWWATLRTFMSDRSDADRARTPKLRSIHDVVTDREENSDPTGEDEPT
jgi:hypothetical protein